MGTTTATVYVRPTLKTARDGSGGVVFFSHRQVAGVYTSNLSATSARVKKNKKPSARVPFGRVEDGMVYIEPAWSKFLGLEINGRKLGGPAFPTLPDVAEIMLLSQQTATAVAQVQAAMQQMITANAQTTQALLEVTQTAALSGSAQIPPPVLTVPETTAPLPQQPDFGDGAGGGGGGGGGDGGDGGD